VRRAGLSLLVAGMILLLVGTAVAANPYGTDYDFKGQTVYFCSWVPGVPGRFLEGGEAEGRLEQAEALFNVKIEFIAPGAYDQIGQAYIARLMAGESVRDVWHLQNLWGFFDVGPAGALYPLNEIYASIPDFQVSGLSETMSLNGEIYAMELGSSSADNRYLDLGLYMVAYNKELLEREGLPDPHELWANGEWTWEAMTEIVSKATRDTNGDGQTDQWGVNLIPPEAFILSAGGFPYTQGADGKMVFAYDSPQVIGALTQMAAWRQAGYQHDSWHFDGFKNGNVALAFGAMWLLADIRPSMEFEYGVVPYPLAPGETEYHYITHALDFRAIPVNAENPRALLALNAFLFDDGPEAVEQYNRVQMGRLAPNRETGVVMQAAIEAWKGETVLPGYTHPLFAQVLTPAMWQVLNGEKTAAAAMAEIRPVAQALIDDMFNQ